MKIAEVFRDRNALSARLDPSHPRFATGSPEDQKRAREDWHRDRFTAEVMRSDLPEIPRADLQQFRFAVVEDTRNGALYQVRSDGLTDFAFVGPEIVAYYLDAVGSPVLLEHPPGPKTRAEFEARRAEREQRRNAPKVRPAWRSQ